jgi:hypothetical protein
MVSSPSKGLSPELQPQLVLSLDSVSLGLLSPFAGLLPLPVLIVASEVVKPFLPPLVSRDALVDSVEGVIWVLIPVLLFLS